MSARKVRVKTDPSVLTRLHLAWQAGLVRIRALSFVAASIITVTALVFCCSRHFPVEWKLDLLAIYSIGAAGVCLVVVAIHSHFAFCGRKGRWVFMALVLLPLVVVAFQHQIKQPSNITVWILVVAWVVVTMLQMGNTPPYVPFLSFFVTATGIVCLILSLGKLDWVIPFSDDLLTEIPFLGWAVDVRRLIAELAIAVLVCYAIVRALKGSFPRIPSIPLPKRLVVPPNWPKLIQSILVPLAPAYNGIVRGGASLVNALWITVASLTLVAYRVVEEMIYAVVEIWANGQTLRHTLVIGLAFVSSLTLVFLCTSKIPEAALNYLWAAPDDAEVAALVSYVLLSMASILGILRFWHRSGAGHAYHALSALTVLSVQLVVAGWLIQTFVWLWPVEAQENLPCAVSGAGRLLAAGTTFLIAVFIVFYFGHFKQRFGRKNA